MALVDNNEAVEDGNILEGSEELYERLTLVVDKGQEPIRIDKFIMSKVVNTSRNKIQLAIDEGMVLVNGKQTRSNYKVKAFDNVIFYSDNSPENYDIVPEKMDLNIVFEDDHILVINKAAGMVVHPGSGNWTGTLINGVAWHLKEQQPDISENQLPRFGMVHRIDKNTSGLIVLAKSASASIRLAKQFFDHTVDRKYIALVWGSWILVIFRFFRKRSPGHLSPGGKRCVVYFDASAPSYSFHFYNWVNIHEFWRIVGNPGQNLLWFDREALL